MISAIAGKLQHLPERGPYRIMPFLLYFHVDANEASFGEDYIGV